MGCKIGMATDDAAHAAMDERRLREEGKKNIKSGILVSGLTYEDATNMEIELRERCGQHCEAMPKVEYVPSSGWSVYYLAWD